MEFSPSIFGLTSVRMALSASSPLAAHQLRCCAPFLAKALSPNSFLYASQSCRAPRIDQCLGNAALPPSFEFDDMVCAVLYRDSPDVFNGTVEGRWSKRIARMLRSFRVRVKGGRAQMLEAITDNQFSRLEHLIFLCPNVVDAMIVCASVREAVLGLNDAILILQHVAAAFFPEASKYAQNSSQDLFSQSETSSCMEVNICCPRVACALERAMRGLATLPGSETVAQQVERLLHDLRVTEAAGNSGKCSVKVALDALDAFQASEGVQHQALLLILSRLECLRDCVGVTEKVVTEAAVKALKSDSCCETVQAASLLLLAEIAKIDEPLGLAVVRAGAVDAAVDLLVSSQGTQMVRKEALWLLLHLAAKGDAWVQHVVTVHGTEKVRQALTLLPLVFYLCTHAVWTFMLHPFLLLPAPRDFDREPPPPGGA
eukprot:gnl/MRDRNA2_/MRDRNA2_158068_c0_seq1.p1 gnl/MRDRNA2_/MRDRNA2_158068_c0~~gnl/MRDRNA2_/MRDRNA2_158068_c0_seq1.p1  ORF type:complete len:429 (-),score=78.71 gnl/MRDRNA2_/MRDRNA2_158068_c0_seq1:2-1288(-)